MQRVLIRGLCDKRVVRIDTYTRVQIFYANKIQVSPYYVPVYTRI